MKIELKKITIRELVKDYAEEATIVAVLILNALISSSLYRLMS